jgi:hypothetical protein
MRHGSVFSKESIEMMEEQKSIAKKLGMSGTQFCKMIALTDLPFELIDNKRHYDYDKVIEAIKNSHDK